MSAKKPNISKENQDLLKLLDEELVLPPLPPDFEQNVLALLGIHPQSSVLDTDMDPATSAHPSDTPEKLYKRGRKAFEDGNYTLAVEQFSLSAKKGYSYAILKLFRMYFFGEGVARDVFEATSWLRLGSELGVVVFNLEDDPESDRKAATG